MLNRDRRMLESLTKKYGKKNIYNIISLNEDSLDDFDIDGTYSRARHNASQEIKNKIHKLLDKNYWRIKDCCDNFFKEKGMNIKFDKFTGINNYTIYYPELIWNFRYSYDDYVVFKILVGAAKSIGESNNYNENKKLVYELGEKIREEIQGISPMNNYSVYCATGEYSGGYKLSIGATLKNLRLNNKRKKVNLLDEWFKTLSIEQLELVTGVDCEDYDNEKEFLKECKKWWINLTPTKQERYYNKFDKVFQRMKN